MAAKKLEKIKNLQHTGTVMYSVFFAVLAVLIIFPTQTQASSIYWEDETAGVSVRYPADWEWKNRQTDDVVLHIRDKAQTAECVIKSHEDRRFLNRPMRESLAIQRQYFSEGFWDNYLHRYKEPVIIDYKNGGLGRGFGSVIQAQYHLLEGDKGQKNAVMAVSRYFDKVYLLECSSYFDDFERWSPVFYNILSTIDFQKIIHESLYGYN